MVARRIRSPNYPALSLPEAIAKAKIIHDRERHLAAPKEVVAKHLGYGGMNGASIKVVSALIKYGLIEEVNGDAFKVSPLALSILYPGKPQDKASAIADAAFRPILFAEIAGEWDGESPSDDNLRAFLVRRNFADDAIERVIKAYRETMELVAQESGVYGASNPGQVREGMQEIREDTLMQHHPAVKQLEDALNPPRAIQPMSVSIKGDRIEVSAVLMDAASVEKLIRTLNATKELLPASKDETAP